MVVLGTERSIAQLPNYLLGYTDNRTRKVVGMRHIYVYSIYADKSPTQQKRGTKTDIFVQNSGDQKQKQMLIP